MSHPFELHAGERVLATAPRIVASDHRIAAGCAVTGWLLILTFFALTFRLDGEGWSAAGSTTGVVVAMVAVCTVAAGLLVRSAWRKDRARDDAPAEAQHREYVLTSARLLVPANETWTAIALADILALDHHPASATLDVLVSGAATPLVLSFAPGASHGVFAAAIRKAVHDGGGHLSADPQDPSVVHVHRHS